jgi:hypothetical protein
MRRVMVVVALAGCSETGVVQMGPNRYRVTQEAHMFLGTAEASATKQAQEHCAKQGQQADMQLNSRAATTWAAASATAEFTCVPR